MLGTIANTGAILTGCVVGSTLKKGIGEKYKTVMMDSMGLAATALGINSIAEAMPESQYHVLFIVSLALGGLIGTGLDLEAVFDRAVGRISGSSELSKGLSTAILLFCAGTLSILGPMQSALLGDNTFLIPMLFWTELLLRYSALPLASVSPLRQRCFFAGRGVSICWQV